VRDIIYSFTRCLESGDPITRSVVTSVLFEIAEPCEGNSTNCESLVPLFGELGSSGSVSVTPPPLFSYGLVIS
jgi:hypothetical protein